MPVLVCVPAPGFGKLVDVLILSVRLRRGRRCLRRHGCSGRLGCGSGLGRGRQLHLDAGRVGYRRAAGAGEGAFHCPAVHLCRHIPDVHLLLAVPTDGDAGEQIRQILALAGGLTVRAGGRPLIGISIGGHGHEGGQLPLLYILRSGVLVDAGGPKLGIVIPVEGQAAVAVHDVVRLGIVQVDRHPVGKIIALRRSYRDLHPVGSGLKNTVSRAAAAVKPAVAGEVAALRTGGRCDTVHAVHGHRHIGQRGQHLADLSLGTGLHRDQPANAQAEQQDQKPCQGPFLNRCHRKSSSLY